MNVVIRKKELKDCAACERVTTLGWQQTYHGIVNDEFLNGLDENEAERTNKTIKKFNNMEDKIYVLEVDSKVVGFVRFGISKDENYQKLGEIRALYIIDGFKGYGFGKKLFIKATEILKAQGFDKMIIGCLEGNKSNEFYKHMGGIKVGIRYFEKTGQKLVENIYYFEKL